ncbi:MAG TPA: inositol monophosphatase family protein, partial [Actinomycetota bacterium]
MYEEELAFANDLADDAARIGLEHFRRDGLEIRKKVDRTLVTAADTAIERMARERIEVAFPEDRIIGEEEGGDHDPAGRVWIVDPVDSTANFARGVQIWATLIALRVDGRGVLGIVSAPALEERYVGVAGGGATLNGEPIHVSGVDRIEDAHVLLQEQDRLFGGAYKEATLGLVAECWRTRGFGDFWAHVLVARGSAEVMLEPKLAIWDLSAPQVVIEEAGGRCTTFEGGPLEHGGSMLATNGAL